MVKIPGTGMLLLVFLILTHSCSNKTAKIIIVTGTPTGDPLSLPTDQRIGLINPSRPSSIKILTNEFYSACSPDLSPDGKSIVFSGCKTQNDPWQIWEMKLGSKKARQVTTGAENCLFPAWLPDGRIVFSRMLLNDSLRSSLALFRCNPDGSSAERITFNPAAWYDPAVLSDGRILAKCSRAFPEAGEPQLIVLRPDGTKAELFYSNKGVPAGGKAVETSGGNLLFVEKCGKVSKLVSVQYSNPFKGSADITGELKGDIISVNKGPDNKLLICNRPAETERYSLVEFDPGKGTGKILIQNNEFDITESVPVVKKENPRKLPSEVDNLVRSGLLLCQDITLSDSDSSLYRKPVTMEIFGINASYGVVKPEQDGSVYLKVMADTPFRIATFDEKGKLIKMCDWMSIRPNERRGCTGCHEKPGIVPENRLPLAVKKEPVMIPVHITRIDEKTVELE